MLNTSIVYYPCIKFAKKVLHLKGFWNIHFVLTSIYFPPIIFDKNYIILTWKAALPLMMTWNAITMGLITGGYQAYVDT